MMRNNQTPLLQHLSGQFKIFNFAPNGYPSSAKAVLCISAYRQGTTETYHGTVISSLIIHRNNKTDARLPRYKVRPCLSANVYYV